MNMSPLKRTCSRQKCPVKKEFFQTGPGLAWIKWLFPLTGILALIWFLVRVIPKPNRAAYPCQRVAAPLASGFLVWLFGLAASVAFFHKARNLLRKSRYIIAGLALAASVFSIWWSVGMTGQSAKGGVFTPSDLPNSPMGIARGIHPGRVVWVHDPNATLWNGSTGYWSDDSNTNQEVVNAMFGKAIRWLSGKSTDTDAWDTIFRYFNQKHNKGDIGYQQGEKIAVKINMVNCLNHGNPGNAPYNSPQLVYALLKQLVNNAGVSPSDITVYDASARIPSTIYDRCSVGDLAGVCFVDNVGGDGRIQAVRDPNTYVHHADANVPPRWLPQHVVQAQYVINLAHMKAHYLPGVTLCAKNHFGSTWVQADPRYEGWRGREGFWPGNDIHAHINAYDTTQGSPTNFKYPARPMGSYNPLVELMGHPKLGGDTILFIIDALYANKDPSTAVSNSMKWLSAPFNDDWTSSIFASQDNVAIDSVALDFLRFEPTITYVADANNYSTADDYLHEAALADAPPSGTIYNPDGNSILTSLGAHEHWNNPTDKQYSRNLGTGCGIELISSATISGDLGGDGEVDLYDLAVLAGNWLQDIQPLCGGDLSGEGMVDFRDFALLAENWMK